METIPQATLDQIVARPNGPIYRHEWIQMSNELKDLRERFNKREDLRILDQFVSAWGANASAADVRKHLTDMRLGDTLIIPAIGYRWRVVKEASPWGAGPIPVYANGGSVPPNPVGAPKP